VHAETIKADHKKAAEKTARQKGEVIRCIQGESSFSRDMLSELIAQAEAEEAALQTALDQAETELADTEALQK